MSRFWSPRLHQLSPYVPGEQPKISNLVKLNTNENPYGPSPRVLSAIAGAVNAELRLYPDPAGMVLREAIARYHGLDTRQVFVGNSSDEILAHVFQAFFQHPRPLLFPDLTYSFYPVYCGLYGIEYQTIPLADDFSLHVEDYHQPNAGIIFANPNAPTGCFLPLDKLRGLLQKNTASVVVVDEAYVDFGGESAVRMINDFPNLLVVQTLSKSRSLAGLRVGFALGSAELVEGLTRVKDSFNSYPLDRLALAGAVAAFADEEYFNCTRQAVMESRSGLQQALQGLGFEMPPSMANFLFVTHPRQNAEELARALRERGIIVRHFHLPRIENYLRITVGTPEQNQALLGALQEILG